MPSLSRRPGCSLPQEAGPLRARHFRFVHEIRAVAAGKATVGAELAGR